jgi:AcrR family transcriptional regulator
MDTREKIIKAGLRVFSEQGYEKATSRLIAEEAGVNEVTLFRLFQNKENILKAVIQANAPVQVNIGSMVERSTGDLHTDLVGLCMGFFQGMKKNRKAIVMSLCAAEKYPEIRKIVNVGPKEQEALLGQYFFELKQRGQIRDLDPAIIARQLIEMLFGLCMSSGLRKSSLAEVESIIRQFMDIFVTGIRKDKK